MARLKPPYGTTAELTSAVMQERDLAYDTTLDRFTMGDGSAAAGKPLAFKSETDALTALVAGLGGSAISAAWGAVVTTATLALGLSAAGLGTEDTPNFAGAYLTPAAASLDKAINTLQTGPTSGSTTGDVYFNHILINGEAVNTSGANVFGLRVGHAFGGSNARGQRAAFGAEAILGSATSALNPTPIYAAIAANFGSAANDNGSDTSTSARGRGIGLNSNAILSSGATFWETLDGIEINTSLRTGASSREHNGLLIAQYYDHAVSGASIDAAIQIVTQSGAVGWATDGIRFEGSKSGSGTLFKTSATVIRGTGSSAVTNIISFPSFTASGYYVEFANFKVTGAGATSALSLLPLTSDGGAVGSASLMWSDVFLASGAVVNFNNGNVTLTHGTNTLTVNNEFIISHTQPALRIDETDAGTDQRYSYIYQGSGTLHFAFATNGFSFTDWLTVSKTSGVGTLAAFGVPVTATGAMTANSATAIPAGGATTCGLKATSTASFGVFFGSGAPSLSAAKGSIYLRSDGSTTNDRAYIATNSSGTWTALTTAA